MPKYAVVIVTYNRLNLLKECINYALNQDLCQCELIIVDNNSTDGTTEFLRTIDNENIHIVYEIENIGGAGGFHDGVKYACERTGCDWILLIDDDAMIQNDYLSTLYKNFDELHSAYAGSVYVNGKIDTRHRSRMQSGAVKEAEYEFDYFESDVATFCGLLISRDLVQRIGYPEKNYFIWEDDTEYSYRLNQFTKIKVIPKAVIDHRTVNPTYKVGSVRDDWKLYYGFRNKLVILKKYKKKREYYIKLFRLYGRAGHFYIKSFFDSKNKEDYRYNSRLRIDSINDARHNHMGKSSNY